MKQKLKNFFSIFADLWHSKRLTVKLAWNDLRKRYAGSMGGIIWAYVVPLMNIVVMWFVFQYGFKSTGSIGGQGNIPYIVWLVPGYIMWSMISDSLMQATNALPEYAYLVKKVQFKTDILPPMKVLSSFFVHCFFLLFALVIFLIFGNQGYWPTWAWLQIPYYLIGAAVLLIGLSWLLSSLAVFLKDMAQIVTIFLQIGFWATPVFWDLESLIAVENPSTKRYVAYYILKCNPFYYLVNGYRRIMITGTPFWAHEDAFWQIPYFWGFSLLMLFLGALAFQKTKKHFADVL
ncbi:MAG: ABC transporter permease [Bacilli bacterium]|nr:ABC transporter permease [Bacilli bacterium]